jgi:hypothetical protein
VLDALESTSPAIVFNNAVPNPDELWAFLLESFPRNTVRFKMEKSPLPFFSPHTPKNYFSSREKER